MKSESEEKCLETVDKWTTSVVFCPDDGFCGHGLDPENTEALKFLHAKVCHIFLKDATGCEQLQETLLETGEFSLKKLLNRTEKNLTFLNIICQKRAITKFFITSSKNCKIRPLAIL